MEEPFGEIELRQILEIFATSTPHLVNAYRLARFKQARLEKAKVTWVPRLPASNSFQCGKIPLDKHDKRWPRDRLPVEIFERMMRGLSRADVLNLRLVSREFEKKVSRFVFRDVVVPFRPQIYRATLHSSGKLSPVNALVESMTSQKEKSREPRNNEGLYNVSYNINDALYDGLKVFEAWGSHIQKFAMTFDIDQGKSGVFSYFR